MQHAELTHAEIENMIDVSIKDNECSRALYWMALLGREHDEDVRVEEMSGVVTVSCGESAFTISLVNGRSHMAYL